MIYQEIILTVSAVVFFLFTLYRRLKEDYSTDIIFSLGFWILGAIFVSQVTAKLFLQEYWFWLGIVGLTFAMIFVVYRFRLRVFEVLDAVVAGIFPFIILIFINDSIKEKSIFALGGFFVVLAIYLLYYFISAHYKKFSWYRSGKVGFAGLGVIGVFFLLRGVASLFFNDMLSFTRQNEIIFSGIFAFSAFLAIFHLARQVE